MKAPISSPTGGELNSSSSFLFLSPRLSRMFNLKKRERDPSPFGAQKTNKNRLCTKGLWEDLEKSSTGHTCSKFYSVSQFVTLILSIQFVFIKIFLSLKNDTKMKVVQTTTTTTTTSTARYSAMGPQNRQ